MKHVTIVALCIFIISISVAAFADQPTQVNEQEQSLATETAEKGKMMEAKKFPSTLITDEEEQASIMKEIDELNEGYVYDEDPHE